MSTRPILKEEKRAALDAALSQRCTRNERLVLLLHYVEVMTHQEVALTLGIHEPMVTRLLNKARTKLRAALRGEGE